mgnify:CR=1 FL=1
MNPDIIDAEAIANLRALNPDDGDAFLREIVGIFLEDTPLRLAELDEALVAGDAPKFVRAAHSIKGSSANLGALQLRATAERLEHQAKSQGLADTGALIAAVKTEFSRALRELTTLATPPA